MGNRQMSATAFIFAFGLILATGQVRAADWYVSPTGSDDAGDGSQGTPWRSIQHAVDSAQENDTIHVMHDEVTATDDFVENISVPADKTGLTIVGAGTPGTYPRIAAADSGTHVMAVESDQVSLTGLELYGTDVGMPAAVYFATGTNGGKVDNCRLGVEWGKGLQRGVWTAPGSTGHTVSNSVFTFAFEGGFMEGENNGAESGHMVLENTMEGSTYCIVTDGSEGNIVTDNVLLDCSNYGISFKNGDNNHASGNQLDNAGILLQGSAYNVFTDNTISSSGILFQNSLKNFFSGNDIYGLTQMDGGYDTLWVGNTFTAGTNNFKTGQGGGHLFIGNVFQDSTKECLFFSGGGNILFFNTIRNCGTTALFSGTASNLFVGNRFENNPGGVAGFLAEPTDQWSMPFKVVYRYGGAAWKGLLGNSYDGYLGADDGSDGLVAGDGIGDTNLPFSTNADGDFYPLAGSPDQYELELWYVNANGQLSRTGLSGAAGPLAIPGNGDLVVAADQQALGNITYQPGVTDLQTSWTYRFFISWIPPTSAGVTAEIGWFDGQQFFAGQSGPKVTITNPENKTLFEGAMEPGVLTIPTGARLALRFTNLHSQVIEVFPYYSLVSPSGPDTPEYPAGGQAAGAIDVSPDAYDFGEVLFGQGTTTTFTITNSGPEDLAFLPFQLAGVNSSDFAVTATTCPVDGTLASQQQCTVDIELFPESGGDKQGALYVVTDDPDAPYAYVPMTAHAGPQFALTVAITPETAGFATGDGDIDCPAQNCEAEFDAGTTVFVTATPAEQSSFLAWQGCDVPGGIICSVTLNQDKQVTAEFEQLLPKIEVVPTSVDFGEAYVGIGSDPIALTIANTGNWDLGIESIALEGDSPSQFSLDTSGCPFEQSDIAPQGSCAVTLRFVPTTDGPLDANLRILSDDPDNGQVIVPLTGTGVSAPRTLSIVILPADSGTVTGDGIDCPGDCEETYPASVALDLAVVPTDGWELVYWQNCDAVQDLSCGLTLTEDRTVYVMLSKLAPAVQQDLTILDFGTVLVDEASQPASATITNLGDAPLVLSDTEVSGLFAADFTITSDACSSATLNAQASCVVSAQFSPKGAMTRAASLRWTSNAAGMPVVAVGLRGWGEGQVDDPDNPDNPDLPTPSGPIMELSPGNLTFEGTAVGSSSEMVISVGNSGDEPLQVQNIEVDGGDDGEFSASHSCLTAIGPGVWCQVFVTFKPTSSGTKEATLWISSDAAASPSKTVSLLGKATGGGGCSTADTPQSGAMLVLLGLLLALFAIRVRTTRLLPLALTVAALLATGCWDATKDCRGWANVETEGEWLGRLNIVQRHEAKVDHSLFECYPMVFKIQQVEYEGAITLQFELEAPLYIGRRYGRGTAVSISGAGSDRTCWVTDGGISILDLVLPEEPQACTEFIEVYFNVHAICPDATPTWDELVDGDETLAGTASFSYTPDDDCPAPNVAISGPSGGDHVYQPGIPDLRTQDFPVLYTGTEVNLITLKKTTVLVDDGSVIPQQKDFELLVEPQGQKGLGNFFCGFAYEVDQAPATSCDAGADPEPLQVVLDDPTGLGIPQVVFQDVFGILPVLPLNQISTGPPVVSSPATGQAVMGPEPMQLVWNPPGTGSSNVTVRLRSEDGEVLAEFLAPDTGSVDVDPAFWGDYAGPGSVEVERSAPAAQTNFPWPVAEGSSFEMSDVHRISVSFGSAAGGWTDPQAPSDLWSDPVQLGQGVSENIWQPWPEVVIDDQGIIAASWFSQQGLTLEGRIQWMDTFEGQWVDPGEAISAPFTHGPLGVDYRDGSTLIWGYIHDNNAKLFNPTAYLVTQDWDVIGGTIAGTEGHENLWRVAGALLPGGQFLIAIGEKYGDRLVASLDGAPFQTLYADDVGASTVTLRVTADGMALAGYQAGNQARVYKWDPMQAPDSGVATNVPKFVSAIFGHGAKRADANGLLHYVWFDTSGDDGLLTHSILDPVTVQSGLKDESVWPGTEFKDMVLDDYRIAIGLDQSIWVLATYQCDFGLCPVLFRRLAEDFWEGPIFPAHAVGKMDLAVDMMGRVHLVYMPVDELGGYEPYGVYHTVMEVVP